MGEPVVTPLGRFRRVSSSAAVPFEDRFVFECPGCGAWAYLDEDQWHGNVSVNHSSEVCTYHETHDYLAALANADPSLYDTAPEENT